MRIVLTGGGTAGHVYPALSLTNYLNSSDLHFIGGDGIEKEILKNYQNIKYHQISPVKLVRKLTLKNFLIPFKLFKAIKEAKKILEEIKPDVVFSKGGFVAVPVVFAAKKLGIKIVGHESDLSLGLANKLILKKCDIFCTSFKQTLPTSKKIIYTGQPIRAEILNGNPSFFKSKFKDNKPCLLVIGGSLGAEFLNKIVWQNLDSLTNKFNVIHISGNGFNEKITHEGYLQIKFSSHMGDVYAASDIVLSRAGSGVINELLALKKPMLLVPLSKKCSRGDQIENANLFFKLNLSRRVFEEDLTPKKLLFELNELIKNYGFYQNNLKNNAPQNAAKNIAEIIKNLALSN